MTLSSPIAIIGAGQVGSRHLQGLADEPAWFPIYLVDPDEESLGVAANRFEEVAGPSSDRALRRLRDPGQLPAALDLVIVATSSHVRASVIRVLAGHTRVGALVLEKVLFQRLADYDEIETLLNEKDIRCWVNCGYRTTELYQRLKADLSEAGPLEMEVSGTQWGLGCNGVHFLDLFAFFTGAALTDFNTVELDADVHESNRAGFKEFTGSLSGTNAKGDRLVLRSVADSDLPWTLRVSAGDRTWVIRDPFEQVSCRTIFGEEERETRMAIPYQSQRTGPLVKQILETGACDLPSYTEAAACHRPFIHVLLDHYQRVSGHDTDACPIT